MPLMSTNELKICSGNYHDGNKKFTGTYVNIIQNGKHYKQRVGVWKFWYINGKMKYEGLYKDGKLVSKKCWNYDGEVINCDLLEITKSEEEIIFKDES
tara:strand:+ start:477 stop:770 length:294 start_codon:yes stop_codon:yes gene_type:complete